MTEKRMKLSTQLSLGILLLAAPIFILSLGVLYQQSRNLIHEEVARHSMNMLNTTMHRARTFIGTIETAANSNTWLIEENFRPDSLLSISRRIVQLNRHVNGCSITAEPDMFPEYGRYFSAYTIRQRQEGTAGDTIITDTDPGKDKDIITMGYEMTAGNQGFIHLKHNGELYHACYMPVPGTSWSLALVCPDSDAMKSYYSLGGLIVALLVIGLLGIVLLCYQAVKQLVNPINQLIDTTQKIADGQYDETIPTTSQKDVLGKLQNCFAMMQQSLNKRMGTLQKNADEIKFLNEKLNNTKLQTEDIVRRKSLFIQQMTQQMRMPLNVIDMNRMLLLLYDATETDATGALSRHRVDEVSCNKLSRECISHTHNHFPETDIRFESELQDTFCLLTNRFYLMGILRELLYNAVRYSYGKDVVLSLTQTDATIRFTVQDLGPRLPANLPELTFKPFTMPEAGIGLSLVRRHAIALGGSMIIDTDYHEGCRIMIEMPK